MRMKHLILSAAIVAAVLFFAGGEAGAQGRICTAEFLPVCAVKANGERSSYGNACQARNDRATILHPGSCIGFICLPVVNEVCAFNPRTRRQQTYYSLCQAENDNAIWLRNGNCRGLR